jgi:hypothetical protein
MPSPAPLVSAPDQRLAHRARLAIMLGGKLNQQQYVTAVERSPFGLGDITQICIDDQDDAVDAANHEQRRRREVLGTLARELVVGDSDQDHPAASKLTPQQVTTLSKEFDRVHANTARSVQDRQAVHGDDPYRKAEIMAMAIHHELIEGHDPVRNAQAFLGHTSWSMVRPEVLMTAIEAHRQEWLRQSAAFID